jgi:soluble lytic murein transglycosylase-like protein
MCFEGLFFAQWAMQNLSGGVQYLANLLRRFHGELRLAVASYYCGSRPLDKRGLAYRNPEVVAYVEAVRRRYERHLRDQQFRRTSLSAGGR